MVRKYAKGPATEAAMRFGSAAEPHPCGQYTRRERERGVPMIGKYTKKPVTVEAMRFDGSLDAIELAERFAGSKLSVPQKKKCIASEEFPIETLEGTMTASKGDFIIKGVRGELYPCKPDIFEATYEKLNTSNIFGGNSKLTLEEQGQEVSGG